MSGAALARAGSRLVRFRGALVRNVEVREVGELQIAERGGDRGYLSYFVIADPLPYSIYWEFRAYYIPDRLIMQLSTGEVIDTGFIGTAIGGPSFVSGTLESTGADLEWMEISAFVKPGWGGTRWDIYIRLTPLFPDE